MTLFHAGDRVRLIGSLWSAHQPPSGRLFSVGEIVEITETGRTSGGWIEGGGWVSGDASSPWGGVLVTEDDAPDVAEPVADREPVTLGEAADAVLLEIRNRQARTLGYADGFLDLSPVTATGADPAYDLGYQEGYEARANLNH